MGYKLQTVRGLCDLPVTAQAVIAEGLNELVLMGQRGQTDSGIVIIRAAFFFSLLRF